MNAAEYEAANDWIGVDLDCTLSQWSSWEGLAIGEPVPAMLARVKRWLAEGKDVRILTARAHEPHQIKAIQDWCLEWVGAILPITASKDYRMVELWDDRAVAVERNTGNFLRWARELPPPILDEAASIVGGDRGDTYGQPSDVLDRVAALWAAQFGWEVDGPQVALALALLKMARLGKTATHRDSVVDLAGYAGIYELAMIHDGKPLS